MSTDLTTRTRSDPDDLSFSFPSKPSELVALTDDELFDLWRRIAFGNRHTFDAIVEKELQSRSITALKEFHASSDQASGAIKWLTIALVVLTVVITAFTIALVVAE